MINSQAQVQQLLFEEASSLDERRWDDWLALMHPEVVFWVPAWHADQRLTKDPAREVSLIYCDGRQALSDRVERVRSGRSPAGTPMPRTVHAIANVSIERHEDRALSAKSNFFNLVYDIRAGEHHVFAGHYEHKFERVASNGPWLLRRKRVVLINDRIPGMLDFYSV
jgi:3-phenylpropionate/cinnamic acid dioxygenase small subunit